jgi:3-phosphoshikimate 1-carboxyvinyltransferase
MESASARGVAEKTSRLEGSVRAPSSKSYTQRAIEMASLAGKVRIRNPLDCADTRAAERVWGALGARIDEGFEGGERYLDVQGFGGKPRPGRADLNVGESGTLLRFVLPVISLAKGSYTVTGDGTLRGRPNGSIVAALQKWGIDIRGEGREHGIPIRVVGRGCIPGGRVEVDGRTTSQTVSSLLMAAPFAESDVTIEVRNDLVSKPYVEIAIDVLEAFRIDVERDEYRRFTVRRQVTAPPPEYRVHGDYSSAAFLIAAACIVESDVTVGDLVADKQGDRNFVEFVRRMGADIELGADRVRIHGPCRLTGIDVDCGDTPDIVPMLATLACFARGTTTIRNISHLVHKESNRIATTACELTKLGARVECGGDVLSVDGGELHPGDVCAHADHRIAMSLLVAGLRVGGVRVDDAACIAKSYPGFVEDMRGLGARIHLER